MISLLVRDWRRVILLCAFLVAVPGAAEAMAADFNDRPDAAARIMPTLVAARA